MVPMISATVIAKIFLPLLCCMQAPDEGSIEALIKKLGNSSFQEREAATQQLLGKWPEAIPALEKALHSSDQETADRAALILKTFDQRPLKRLEHFVAEGRV